MEKQPVLPSPTETGLLQLLRPSNNSSWTGVAVLVGGLVSSAALVAGLVWWWPKRAAAAPRASSHLRNLQQQNQEGGGEQNEELRAARFLVAELAPEVEPERQLNALLTLIHRCTAHDIAVKAFVIVGGVEAVVRLFLAVDPDKVRQEQEEKARARPYGQWHQPPPPPPMLALTQFLHIIALKSENRALVTSNKVAEKIAALYASTAVDVGTKLACVGYMRALCKWKEVELLMTTSLRVALFHFFMDAVIPAVDPLLLLHSTNLFNLTLIEAEDRGIDLSPLFEEGLASHALQLLQDSMKFPDFEPVRWRLLQTVLMLVKLADVATCREILDAPFVACLIAELLRLFECQDWPALLLEMETTHLVLSKETAPLRLARPRFQAVFLERGGQVSAAVGRDDATGLDVLVDMLCQTVPPLAPHVLAMLTLLCQDNVAVQEALRGNKRAMAAIKRMEEEPDHPGRTPALELLLLLEASVPNTQQ